MGAFLCGGRGRSRTGLDGFAIHCITALLPGQSGFRGLPPDKKTPVFLPRFLEFGAGNETRTRDPNLGKVVLYQLSYSRFTRSAYSIQRAPDVKHFIRFRRAPVRSESALQP